MVFSFNIYSSLLLPAVIQCLVFAALSIIRYLREKKASDGYLALLLLFIAIKLSFWMFGFGGWYDSHNLLTSLMFYFPFSAYLLSGPVVYFYFKSLVDASFRLSRRDWSHFILPILYIILIAGKLALDLYFYYPFPHAADFQFGTRGSFAEIDKSAVVSLLGFFSFFFYLVLIFRSFPAYRAYVRENFSDTGYLDFDWLKQMLIAVSAGVLILFFFNVWDLFLNGVTYKANWYAYLALGITAYYLAINGYYRQGRVLRELAFTPLAPLTENKEDPLPGDEQWLSALNEIMQTARPYLQPELSLADLAQLLGTNKTVLSRVINTRYQQSFNDFINRYRVDAVIALLQQGLQQQITLLGIAYDCGFNSKATFNRAFKKVTGQSPKNWSQRIT